MTSLADGGPGANDGDMTITFITGANKGLGHETARRLIDRGHTVLLGARDPELGAAAARALGARFVPIDVTSDESAAAAAADVEKHEGLIDVLINNAGVHGPAGDPSELTGADVLGVFDVNVAGVVRATTAFLPLLHRSADPVIINVSSAMGSLAATHDHADHPVRQGLFRDKDQRRRSRLHRDRPQRRHRAADRHRGHRRDRGPGHRGTGPRLGPVR
jgi:NAD(P)-dependent dehydrogenase (short-subunit alcohol dehydrogenase family)